MLLLNLIGMILIPNKIISSLMLSFNAIMFKTPYLCVLNSIINIIANPSWQGIVFSLLWLNESQNFVIGEIPVKFRQEITKLVNYSKWLKPTNNEIFWTSLYADNGNTTNIKYSKELYNYFNYLF